MSGLKKKGPARREPKRLRRMDVSLSNGVIQNTNRRNKRGSLRDYYGDDEA